MSLVLEQVSRTFGGKQVIRNVSLTAEPGEIIGLLGTSGCGKSTLLRAISGLDTEYSGTVSINGDTAKQVHKATGFIFQEPRLLPWLTVLENVRFGLEGKKEDKNAIARKYLKSVGLAESEALYPRELSGGMAQRVAIARALVTSPEILLLDEPFSALDAFTKMQLQDLLLEVWKEFRTTIVLVTHDIDEALYLCDRVLMLRGAPGEISRELAVNQQGPRLRGSEELTKAKAEILADLKLVVN
ncbi:ABC transporter ATP-binding protein [Planococcus sp. SIMBA_160]